MKWLLLTTTHQWWEEQSVFLFLSPCLGNAQQICSSSAHEEDSVLLEPFKPTQSSLHSLEVWYPPLLQSLAESQAVPERDKTFLNSSGEGTGVYSSLLVERKVPILLPSFRFQTIIKTVKPEMLLHIYWITKPWLTEAFGGSEIDVKNRGHAG